MLFLKVQKQFLVSKPNQQVTMKAKSECKLWSPGHSHPHQPSCLDTVGLLNLIIISRILLPCAGWHYTVQQPGMRICYGTFT